MEMGLKKNPMKAESRTKEMIATKKRRGDGIFGNLLMNVLFCLISPNRQATRNNDFRPFQASPRFLKFPGWNIPEACLRFYKFHYPESIGTLPRSHKEFLENSNYSLLKMIHSAKAHRDLRDCLLEEIIQRALRIPPWFLKLLRVFPPAPIFSPSPKPW